MKVLKVFFIYLFTQFIFLTSVGQSPNILWQKSLGGSYYDKAVSVIELEDGGYIVGGHSQSSNFDLLINHGGYDWWIVRLNNSGNILWQKTLGGSNDEYLRKIIKTPDGSILCIGDTQSNNGDIISYMDQIDFWVTKIDLSGNLIWEKCFGGVNIDRGYSVCDTDDGNFMIAGSTESQYPYIENNHGLSDFLLIKIDQEGNKIWQKTYGGSGHETCKSIKKSNNGGYLLIGNSSSIDGDLSNNYGEQDVWMLKVDNEGIIQWQQNFGGSKDDFIYNFIEDHEGNFVIIGETYSFDIDATDNHGENGSRDFFIIKVSAQGQKIWSNCYGGSSEEYARGIVESNGSEYVVVGESYSNDGQATNNIGSADIWIIKLNIIDGELIWQKKYGSEGHDEPNDLILTFDNNFLFVGNTLPFQNFNDVTQHYGGDDFWIVKLLNNDCVKNLSLKTDMLYGNKNFISSENISSSTKIISPASQIIYSAGKSILLQSGFSTQNGTVFEAKIEGCN
jgi:hypothetical protein